VAAPNVNALGFAFLARHLGPDQPVYGVQCQDAANLERFYTPAEYEALAAFSVSELTKAWPEGPVLLCGFCEGAHIAFEMARQLTAAGRDVGLLAMFDAWALENTASRFRHYLDRNYRRCLNWLRRPRFSRTVAFLRRQVYRLTGYAPRRAVASAETNGAPSELTTMVSWHRWKERMWPGKDFVPPVYDGRITVFRVRRQPFWRVRDDSLGWKARAAQGVAVHEIPGKHSTILRDSQAQALAARLAECISQIDR
jgi:thioesterase domain-containing protein